MIWTASQIEDFKKSYGEASVEAETLWRAMAEELCPDVLHSFDQKWNQGEHPLGPNWHAFGGDLEDAIKAAHENNASDCLDRYYSFLNWALFVPNEFISNEVITSPASGIISELAPSLSVGFRSNK